MVFLDSQWCNLSTPLISFSTGIHGVQSGCVSENGKTYCPTSFMNPVNFGATWNDSQVFMMGVVIAEETRALWLAGAQEESSWSGRPHIGLDLWR